MMVGRKTLKRLLQEAERNPRFVALIQFSKEIFLVLFVTVLLLLIADGLDPGCVTRYFDIIYVLIPVILFGSIWMVFYNVVETPLARMKGVSLRRTYLLSVTVGILTGLWVWVVTNRLGALSVAIAAISAALLSLIVVKIIYPDKMPESPEPQPNQTEDVS